MEMQHLKVIWPRDRIAKRQLATEVIGNGALVGLLAGFIALAIAMVHGIVEHGDVLVHLRTIGRALAPASTERALIGFAAAATTSALFGIAFAAIFAFDDGATEAAWGIVYGTVIFILMEFVAIPIVAPKLMSQGSAGIGLLASVVYGGFLGLYAPLRRRLFFHPRPLAHFAAERVTIP